MGKALKLSVFFVFALALLGVAGQFAGGLLLLNWFDQPLNDVSIYTYYSYYSYYGFDSHIRTPLLFATGLAYGLPGMMVVIAVAAFMPSFDKMKNLHGNARFATAVEISKKKLIYVENAKIALGKRKFLSMLFGKHRKHPPVILGKYKGKYLADYSQLYTSVAASPGAGKGVGFVIPNLLQYPHSCVVLDPKKENWEITAGYRSLVLHQECFLFAPDADANSGYQSHCWNPLDYVSDDIYHRLSSIKQITSIIIAVPEGDNQSFYLGAQDLVNGLILYLVESQRFDITMSRVLWMLRHENGLENFIKLACHKDANLLSDGCKGLLLSYANNENARGRDSIKNIAISSLSVFDSKTVAEATSRSDFRFEDLRKKRMSIYIGVGADSMKTYRRLLNLFFSQCIVVNVKTLPENAPKNDPMPYQCLMLIDEFPALGKVDIIRESSGYTRGYNLRYGIILQNRSQAESKELYGKEGADALLDTMHNELVLKTDSLRDAEEYSKRLGNRTIKDRPRSRTKGRQGSTTIGGPQYHKRELMNSDEVLYMPDEKCLIFTKELRPILADKIFWYKDELFKDRGNMPLPSVPSLIGR